MRFFVSPIGALLLLLSLFAATRSAAEPPEKPGLRSQFVFLNRPPYRPGIPDPKSLLGYEPGDRHSTFRDQERVLLAIAEAARDRVKVTEYGSSVEGRPLRLFIIASPENQARLETIREDNLRLADPRRLPANRADAMTANAPLIFWINQCIHGDETASFETAMWTLFTLAASDSAEVNAILRNTVVILNPVFNPDGHERFVVWYNSVALGNPEPFAHEKSVPWALRGRFNHFRFDMNRDKLAQSQAETRQETAAQLSWYPHVYIDQHGQPSVYFFPPNAPATNLNVDRERVDRWTGVFGKANAASFDRYGWNYVVRETFDFFAPIYLDSFATLSGAIGMTYETDGGGNLARRRSDGTISTLRDAVARHFETALTTLATASERRQELLSDFVSYRRKAIRDGARDRFRRVVFPATNDPGRLAELATLLRRVGIEVMETTAPLSQNQAHPYLASDKKAKKLTLPTGSLVVDLSQPQGLVARAFLEPDPAFEPEFLVAQYARRERNERKNDNEGREGYDFYDITAWSLPLTFGLEAYWTEDAPTLVGRPLELQGDRVAPLAQETGGIVGTGTVGFVIRPDRDHSFVLALRLLGEGYRVSSTQRPLRIGAVEYPAGTFFLRSSRNPEGLADRIRALSASLRVPVEAIGQTYPEKGGGLGSDTVFPLRRPRIAVATDEGVNQTGYGSVWYFLDKFGIPFTAVKASALSSLDLNRFNVIVLPDGYYASVLGKGGMSRLKDFVSRGGVLLGFGGGGVWFTDKEAEISSSRPIGDAEEEPKEEGESDKKPKRPLELAGSIFRAGIDTRHFLGWGYPTGEIAVPLAGSTFLKPSKTGTNVVTFGKSARLSGFAWPNNTETLLERSAYVIDEPIGNGHALLFLDDPTQRALWPGLNRLVLAGILFGNADGPADPLQE
ncbi:MAG: M14 family zinc carboxypeptidase [Capsulimonadales bacterium]|nr:M14 family zinc carboxypeptidase [Capsulimonadales bacterium]